MSVLRTYRRFLWILVAIYISAILLTYNRMQGFSKAKEGPSISNSQFGPVVPEPNVDLQVPPLSPSNVSALPRDLVYVTRGSGSECPHLRRPENVRESFRFQQVDGKNETFVFSAFLDERDHLVRVIAVRLLSLRSNYLCHLWYDVTSSALSITSATVEVLPENQGKKYSATYIHCPLPKTGPNGPAGGLPYAVSVTSRDCHHDVTAPTNVLRVMTSEGGRKGHNFTVCMKPVNMKYSRAYEAIEFIEMSRLLGADKIQVYLTSVGANVLHVLRWYQTQGIVELIDWQIDKHMHLRQWPPSPKTPEIHAFGQIGASNDCLFRNRRSSRYLVMADWDEMLVPKKHATWAELIAAVDSQHGGKGAGEYRFACLFFRKDFPPREEDFAGRALALKYRSMVLMVNKRESKPVRPPSRSKYIIDPEKIHATGIHTVHRHRGGSGGASSSKIVTLSQDLGSNYHYRNWEKPQEYSSMGVRDDDMLRFKDALLERLQEVWSHFPNVSMDIPLSSYGDRV